MRNKFEHILLSLVLGLSILLGLSFWMNTRFLFNMFCKEHWDELAKLQAKNIPIDPWFYLSIGIALFIFLAGLIVIYIPLIKSKNIQKQIQEKPIPSVATIQEPVVKEEQPIKTPEQKTLNARPPRLNLPKNFEFIVKQKHENSVPAQTNTKSYNDELAQIFSENGYVVKQTPVISGFSPNLFAIGNNETLWIGGVDCKIEDLQNAITKLNTVFKETLEDIEIHINSFLIDTLNKYNVDESILIVHSVDDIKKYIIEHPIEPLTEDDQDNFKAYSEYIDTIIQYIRNL